MKYTIKLLVALALAVGLNFASAATTSTLTQAITFNGYQAAFSDTIAAGFTNFNDLFTFTTPSSYGGASVIASFNGINFSTGFSAFNLVDVTNNNSVVATGTISPSFAGNVQSINSIHVQSGKS